MGRKKKSFFEKLNRTEFVFSFQPKTTTSDNMNFEPSWAFDKMAFDFPMDPFGTLEVEGGFKGENLFGKCEESFISEMVDETEKEELERIKAKYQNNLEFSKDVIIAEQKSLEQNDKMEEELSPLSMGASNPIGIPDIFRKRIGTDLSVTSDYCSYDGNNLEFENHDQNLDGCPMSGTLTDLKDRRMGMNRLADTSHS